MSQFEKLIGLMLLLISLVACGSGANDAPFEAEAAPPVEAPTKGEENEGSIENDPATSKAIVEEVDTIVNPGVVVVIASGSLPDGCTTIEDIQQSREGDTFIITLMTERPEDQLCTQALEPFEEQIMLEETADLPDGTYAVNVNGQSAQFVINQNSQAEPAPSPTPAALDISPQSGPAGTVIQLTGRGFLPNSEVELTITGEAETYQVVELVTTDVEGTFALSHTVPAIAQPGSRFTAVARGPEQVVDAVPFEVTEENALIDQVEVYLVALEDAGRSGPSIGCGDSLVPVQMEIEPTIAPLRAALENLLSLNDQYYGQSGLYNALYRSDLAVEGIDLDQGQAEVNLSGSLQIGGTCDTPRVESQLRQTALQFKTVDSVEFNLNGQPLAQKLSPQDGDSPDN